MRISTALLTAKFLAVVPLAMALSVLALASPAVAQDPSKTQSATPAAKQFDAPSDRQQRRERRHAEAAAKQTDAAAGGKSDTLAKFPKAEDANAAAAKPKMECRKQEVTGSRLGKNICATPEQWAQTDAAAAEAVRQMRSDVNNQAGAARPQANPFSGGAVGP